MSLELKLPTERKEITRSNPRLLIIYAPPKAGKTTLLSSLPNNLILDLEDGTEYLDSLSMKIIGWAPPNGESEENKKKRFEEESYYLTEAGAAIIKAGRPYDFITIDTATELENIIMPLAVSKYKETGIGKNYDGDDVRDLARGAGYLYLRKAYKEALDKIKKLANTVILVGHLRDTIIEKQGKEVQALDLDLTGKIKQITCSDADAIGYLHRGVNSELLINFKSSDEILCGSRCPHLKGQEIKIADYDPETNSLINVSWELIFPDTIKK